jgi:hypothetical protein
MAGYEALEIILNECIVKFNDIHEQIKENEYEDVIELSKLVGKSEALRDVINSLMTAKEFMI